MERLSGIEVTKIYVGYDWAVELLMNEIKEYRINREDIEGYLEHKKLGDKLEIYEDGGDISISPKIFPMLEKEYKLKIKNKILEKIRKQMDNYERCDINIIYAEITSPEYFDDITDLEGFINEISCFIAQLRKNLEGVKYYLVIKMNRKWIMLDLNDANYTFL